MLADFRSFVLRGNVVDLAVGVVIGAAFGAVVTSLVQDVLTPLLGALGGTRDFGSLAFTVNGSEVRYGRLVNALLAFLLVAAALFFLVVRPLNVLMARLRTEPDVDTPTRDCPECLSAVPAQARRCAFCTTPLPAA